MRLWRVAALSFCRWICFLLDIQYIDFIFSYSQGAFEVLKAMFQASGMSSLLLPFCITIYTAVKIL